MLEATTAGYSVTGGGTPTLTISDDTTPTGPHHYDNAANWDDGAIPIAGDTLIIPGDKALKYEIESLVRPAEVHILKGAQVGLPRVNRQDVSFPYEEHLPQHYQTSGTGACTFTIGEGDASATASQCVKVDGNNATATYNIKGSGQILDGEPAIQLKGVAGGSADVNVDDGQVGLAYYEEDTININAHVSTAANPSDLDLYIGPGCDLTSADVVIRGGDVKIFADTVTSADIFQTGGTCYVDKGSWQTIHVHAGTMTLGNVTIATGFELGGTLDCDTDYRAKTVTPLASIFAGATINDRATRTTWTAGRKLVGCTWSQVNINDGYNQTYS